MHDQKTTFPGGAQAQKWPTFFMASQLALALGVTRTRAHQLMSGAGASRQTRDMGGVQAHCWPVEALPARVAADLNDVVKRKGYCNLAHLLADPPQAWQPPHSLNALAPGAVVKAQTRRGVLAPILKAKDAQTARVSELVRRAGAGFASLDKGSDAAGERAIRRWIEDAIDRDRGLWQWDRLEIYLDEKPDLKSDAARQGGVLDEAGGEALAAAILTVQEVENPSEEERATIFNAAFHRVAFLVKLGLSEGKARRTLLRILVSSGVVLFPDSEAARLKHWQRCHARWSKNGCNAEALRDGREFNPGRPPIASPTADEKKALQTLKLQTGSTTMALHMLADLPLCSVETREAIHRSRTRRRTQPLSLRRAASITPEQTDRDMGTRENPFVSRRNSLEQMEDGTFREIEAGDWWELDDMSWNQPFWFENLDGDDRLAQKHEVCMARQCLLCIDVKSGKWLGAEFIGRGRDSYRAEDILRFFRNLFRTTDCPGAV